MERLLIRLIPLTLLVDWLVDFELVPGIAGVLIKAMHLALGAIVLIRLGLPRHNGLTTIAFGGVLILYSIGSSEIWLNLYMSVRSLYWIVVSLAIVQVISRNRRHFEYFLNAIRLTILVGSFATLMFMFEAETHHNGSSYLLLWSCGLLVFLTNWAPKDKWLLGISALAVIVTVKRGAILSMSLMTIVGFIFVLANSKFIVATKYMFLGGVVLAALLVFVESSGSLDKLLLRMEDRSGSGRDLLYAGTIGHYLSGEPHNVLFGFGVNSVQAFTKDLLNDRYGMGVQAHSDWLQMVHDFGLVGLLLMLSFLRKFWLIFKRSRRTGLGRRVASLALFILFLTSTTYSFILWDPSALVMAVYLNHVDRI